jgi:MoxR-like ATPase
MYATLILSQSPYGIRQTALIPANGTIRVFNRCGFGRGSSGSWSESAPDTEAMDELTINSPISILMTSAHVRDADFLGRTPNNVLQALLKRVGEAFIPNASTLYDVYNNVVTLLTSNPHELAKYAMRPATIPTVKPVTVGVQMPTVSMPVEPVAPVQVTPTITQTETPMTAPTVTTKSLNVLTIPEPQQYFERVFEDVPESKIYDVARANQQNVLLTGDAGTGKTSSARNYAATRKLPFVVIECTQQIDTNTTQGRFVPGEDGQSVKWVYSQLATAIQQPSVVLLNELTRMSPKSSSLFLRLLQERELFIEPFNEVIKVHPECLFIADANVGASYNGTMRQDMALVDRFNIKLPFTYDSQLESKFIPYPALLAFATSIRTATELGQEDFTTPMSTRLLQNFVMQANSFNWQFAVQRLLSNFPTDTGERDAIKMRLDADAPRIAREFNVQLEQQ